MGEAYAHEKGLVNLEARINQCRTMRQRAETLRYESDPLLSLTAFVANQSRGMVRLVPSARSFL